MAIGTQIVKIHSTSDGQIIYQATTQRNTDQYPLTSAGQAAFEADASAGNFTLTVDNGVVIPAGTRPPLTKPGTGPTTAFSQKIQAEDATGTGSSTGASGDNNVRGPYSTSSDYLLYTIASAPLTAANYNLTIRYKTTTQMGGLGTVIVNSGTPVDFPLEGVEGDLRTYSLTVSLNTGNNTIQVQGKSGTAFFQDYIIVTRAAG